ncbi:MAG: universal stress protein [Syntrophobacterales bacterium]|nr:universal stress protein [Syntrophobacterales bacterium]
MDIFPPLVCPARWDKLMVCTDGSAEGQNAVAVTLELAQACGSRVYVVQVLEAAAEFQAVAPDLRSTLETEIQKNFEVIKAAAAKLGVDLELMMPESQLTHAAIVAAAAEVSPDLVIIGRCGKTALARLLMGNVTAKVIGHSPVNVLVVPRGGMVGFQRILVASDGSPHSEAAWKLALALAKQAGSQLIGVAVAPEEGDILEAQAIIHRLLKEANLAGMPLKGVSPQGVAADTGIVQQAIKNEVDLIVLGSHGRTGLRKILMGSVAERVIGQSPCPILVVKKEN